MNGARKHGISILDNSMEADALVIWSVLWNGRMLPNKALYEHYRNTNRPVIVMDVGTLKRNITWKVAVNHITAEGHYGHMYDLDFDRPKKLGLQLKKQVHNNGAILLTGQHAKSKAIEPYNSQESWMNQTIQTLRNYTDRPIVVRPHPRSRINTLIIKPGVRIEIPKAIANTYDDFDINYGYHAVINYNSGPGIQAAINGARVVVDSTSLAYPISNTFETLEDTCTHDINSWFITMCHTEYTVDELDQGVWLQRISRTL